MGEIVPPLPEPVINKLRILRNLITSLALLIKASHPDIAQKLLRIKQDLSLVIETYGESTK